ncbi:cohesin domain-containing protein [Microbacterium sp. A196]|uniref:cohesin domain-containing protein n=1 Tax=Microbacterium sp. A196 TaxID=3457320 RepID=UPI003FD51AE9
MPRSTPIHPVPRRRLATITTLVLVGLAALTIAPAAYAASVTAVAVAAPADVTVGDNFAVTVTVAGSADLFAYEAEVEFDESVITFVPDSDEYPDGGFGAAAASTDSVALTYTRLGSSPGLAGDLIIATLEFTAVAEGDAALSAPTLTLVGTDGVATAFTDVTVDAVMVAEPTPPTPTPTTPPVTEGGGGGGNSPTDKIDGDLASTGGSTEMVGVLIGAALAAIAAGIVLFARRARKGAVR